MRSHGGSCTLRREGTPRRHAAERAVFSLAGHEDPVARRRPHVLPADEGAPVHGVRHVEDGLEGRQGEVERNARRRCPREDGPEHRRLAGRIRERAGGIPPLAPRHLPDETEPPGQTGHDVAIRAVDVAPDRLLAPPFRLRIARVRHGATIAAPAAAVKAPRSGAGRRPAVMCAPRPLPQDSGVTAGSPLP